jgi:hypothetical protein
MQRYVKYIIYSICLIIICTEIFLRYASFGSYPVYDLDQK